ncbi:hypothetical protein BC828DRAFT_73023 [Blastocladiella britannica]|nr:hypothetical protein BC828DRAFT_73023 [Blastocladiella britannica]
MRSLLKKDALSGRVSEKSLISEKMPFPVPLSADAPLARALHERLVAAFPPIARVVSAPLSPVTTPTRSPVAVLDPHARVARLAPLLGPARAAAAAAALSAAVSPATAPLTVQLLLCGRAVATAEFLFSSPSLLSPPDLVVVCTPPDPSFTLTLDDLAPELRAWTPVDAVASTLRLLVRVRELLCASHARQADHFPHPRIAFDWGMARDAFPGAEAAILCDAATSSPSSYGTATDARDEEVLGLSAAATMGPDPTATTVLFAVPLHIPFPSPPPPSSTSTSSAVVAAPPPPPLPHRLSTASVAITDNTLPPLTLVVLVQHLLVATPSLDFELRAAAASHWVPEPWVQALEGVNWPVYDARQPDVPLVDYLGRVAEIARAGVTAAVNGAELRRRFLEGLAGAVGDELLECNGDSAIHFMHTATPTTSTSPTMVMCSIALPDRFPNEPPTLVLRGVMVATVMPTSPSGIPAIPESSVARWKLWTLGGAGARWALDEMVARTRGWVADEAGGFVARSKVM